MSPSKYRYLFPVGSLLVNLALIGATVLHWKDVETGAHVWPAGWFGAAFHWSVLIAICGLFTAVVLWRRGYKVPSCIGLLLCLCPFFAAMQTFVIMSRIMGFEVMP